jgi:nicotinamide-nucleotide amidase
MAEINQDSLEVLAAELGADLVKRGWSLAAAESCTGGWAAQAMTAVAGSSAWFDRGFVTYSNEAKMDMLGVRAETLEHRGAVSEETVAEMAKGAIERSRARVAFAISGIAGPSGGSDSKPVGTVCFAWAVTDQPVQATTRHFDGDRRMVRMQSVDYVLRQMRTMLASMP